MVPTMTFPAAASRRNAPSVMPPAPISRSMSSSQITEPWSVTSLASRSASAVLLSGMATGQEPNSSAMTRAAIFVLPTMEEPISRTGRPARR